MHLILILTIYAVAGIDRCSGSASGSEIQRCGNRNYYCKLDNQCKPRYERCVGRGSCVDDNGVQDGCNCDEHYRFCDIYLVKTYLSSSFSSRDKRQENHCYKYFTSDRKIEHHFIEYKGFAWEFGWPYQLQILDVNDPNYKYNREKGLRSIKSRTFVGTSFCSYDAALFYALNFNKRYGICSNNCQHFAKGLQQWLLSGCTYNNGGTNETLDDYFAKISTDEYIYCASAITSEGTVLS